jgi:hypothetical protein
VVALRSDPGADLVLAPIRAGACERGLAALLPLLRPGGFLVVAPAPGADANRSDGPASIVRAAQQSGLQYWQHVVAVTPALADGRQPAAGSQLSHMRAADQKGSRAIRCHHDLLVFRRPALADAALAAAIEGVAA